MALNRSPQPKGQGALEYLLLCGIVSFLALFSFAPNGFLSKVSNASSQYYSTITSVIQGKNPQKIDGGWCPAVMYPGGAGGYRTCECPSPAFGGAPCLGDSKIGNGGEGGASGNVGGNGSAGSATCGNGKLELGEQCDDGPQNGVACTKAYGGVCSYCSSSCEKVFVSGGRCGDGIIQSPNEECDNGDVNNGKQCSAPYNGSCDYCDSSCKKQTRFGPKCGDGHLDQGEVCDAGAANGVPCEPPYAGACSYCAADCKSSISVNGVHCGDGKIDAALGEECDDGANNGKQCALLYGADNCSYCSLSCKKVTLIAPKCGDGNADLSNGEQCDGSAHCNSSCKCDAGYTPDGKGGCVSSCGNNHLDPSEECDSGAQNGQVCTVTYGGTDCYYCSSSCKLIKIPAPRCGDGNCNAADGENCSTCPADCGCSSGQTCVTGTCQASCGGDKPCGTAGACYAVSGCDNQCDSKKKDDACGTCGGSVTSRGTCTPTDQCGSTAGTDNCGACTATAGTCPTGYACSQNHTCVCTPQCSGKNCGNDGCGGLCGPTCPSSQYCNGSGVCTDYCGNGILDPGEACDGTAASSPYPSSCGTPAYNLSSPNTCKQCTKSCTVETVYGPYCGDGKRNGSEVCDAGSDNGDYNAQCCGHGGWCTWCHRGCMASTKTYNNGVLLCE